MLEIHIITIHRIKTALNERNSKVCSLETSPDKSGFYNNSWFKPEIKSHTMVLD